MTNASSLAFPGSRTLATWGRQLQSHEPAAIWAGYLFLHRLDASVQCLVRRPLEPLAEFILQALTLEAGTGSGEHVNNGSTSEDAWLWRLDRRLHLGLTPLRRLLHGLADLGLV